MVLEPVKRPRLSNEIVSQLQRLFTDGVLKPGDRLPPERELAEKLGVSRNSLREAIRALEVLGVVEVRHGDGTFVKSVDMTTFLSPVFSVLLEKKYFLIEVLEFRRILEPPICRLAAERATDEDLAHLHEILDQQDERIREGQPAIDEDMLFHRSIAMATHNDVMRSTVELISSLLREFREVWASSRPARSTEAHRKVLDAIEAGDGDGAARAMEEHIYQVEALVRADLAVLADSRG